MQCDPTADLLDYARRLVVLALLLTRAAGPSSRTRAGGAHALIPPLEIPKPDEGARPVPNPV